MEWGDVRYFLELSRAGSFGAAARQLKVNQTTVARRLKTLEDSLGTRLFERTPDGVVLTAAGEAIRAAGGDMEEAAIVLERRASGEDARPSGMVRLTSTDLLGAYVVVPALEVLRGTHPAIRCELHTGTQALDIARREADLAVRLSRPRGTQLVGRRAGTVGYAAYASRAYLAERPAGAPEGGLAGHDIVAYDESTRPAASLRIAGEPVREARLALRTNSPLALMSAVSAGFGIGELACYLADARPELVRVWPDLPPHSVDIWLLVHPDLHRTARIRAVLDVLVAAFEVQGPSLRGERPFEVRPPPTRRGAPTRARRA
jgi:DNA-binding transcriptional LysR family regulator